MNIRKVIQYLKLRSQLSEEELSLAGVMAGLTESERELLVESLQPQKAAVKRGRKVGTKTAVKSARGASLQQQLQSRTKTRVGDDSADDEKQPICSACGNVEDYADHSQPSPHYHPFASSSPARSAASRSSLKKSDETRSAVSSEEAGESVAVAVGGSNE